MATHRPAPRVEELLEELSGVSAKWRLIGSKLRIDTARLDEIAANRQDAKHNLLSVLEEWERHAYLSWERIVQILKSSAVNETVRAREIEARYGSRYDQFLQASPPPIRHPTGPITNASAGGCYLDPCLMPNSTMPVYSVITGPPPSLGGHYSALSRGSQPLPPCPPSQYSVVSHGRSLGLQQPVFPAPPHSQYSVRALEQPTESYYTRYSRGRPQLQDYGWLHRDLKRDDATQLLNSCAKHSFLMRYSESIPGTLVLSVKADFQTKHFQIKWKDQKCWVDGTNQGFKSLEELVHYHSENDIDGDVKLKTPYMQWQGILDCALQEQSGAQKLSDGSLQLKEPNLKTLIPISWHCDSKWELPVEMIRPQVVRIGSDVYFSGESGKRAKEADIHKFNEAEGRWYLVCTHHITGFSLAELDGKLITVGGLEKDVPSRCVYFLDGSWKRMPSLRIARANACTFSHCSNLIVIGGITEYLDTPPATIECTNTIEILAKNSPSWMLVDWVLPVPLYNLTFAITSEAVFILGGCTSTEVTADACYVPLSNLVHSAPLQTQKFSSLSCCPFSGSTAAVVDGTLLSIGGQDTATQCITGEVYAYSFSKDEWEKVPGNLPAARILATAVQINASKIAVVGGFEKQGEVKKSAFVNI